MLLEQILLKMHSLPQIAMLRAQGRAYFKAESAAEGEKKSDAAPLVVECKPGLELDALRGPVQINRPAELSSRNLLNAAPSNCKSYPVTPAAPSSQSVADHISKDAYLHKKSIAQGFAERKEQGNLIPHSDIAAAPPVRTEQSSRQDFRSDFSPRAMQLRETSKLALLPPTVIKGVSLVSLSQSQKDVLNALAKNHASVLSTEVVQGWSVLSVSKPNSKDCAVQIFLRRENVEAIRVFDSCFLRPELGVNIGDDLSKVKEKFGEPAFIISEESSSLTQNYIYPLNQVGFQLSKSILDHTPKVISLLVFSVN